MQKENFIHSPLNYTGGKFKILKDIIPWFPSEIGTFVDLFAGGLNVGINISARKIIANDQLSYLIDVYRFLQKTKWKEIHDSIVAKINNFKLSITNKDGYALLRKQYNATHDPLELFLLTCYSFNHQIRFNSKHEFNTPFGMNRSSYNDSINSNLQAFVNRLQNNNIQLSSVDFLSVDMSKLGQSDFVYCDPPYLITTGAYNDGKRGFKDWTNKEEGELLSLLDQLNDRGIKFALSNVLTHKGLRNDQLIEWSGKYTVTHIQKSYSNCSYHFKSRKSKTDEVLITNYLQTNLHTPCQMTFL